MIRESATCRSMDGAYAEDTCPGRFDCKRSFEPGRAQQDQQLLACRKLSFRGADLFAEQRHVARAAEAGAYQAAFARAFWHYAGIEFYLCAHESRYQEK